MTRAIGCMKGNQRRIVIGLDDETFAQISEYATFTGVSFAEAARTLIEWGLEAINAG